MHSVCLAVHILFELIVHVVMNRNSKAHPVAKCIIIWAEEVSPLFKVSHIRIEMNMTKRGLDPLLPVNGKFLEMSCPIHHFGTATRAGTKLVAVLPVAVYFQRKRSLHLLSVSGTGSTITTTYCYCSRLTLA